MTFICLLQKLQLYRTRDNHHCMTVSARKIDNAYEIRKTWHDQDISNDQDLIDSSSVWVGGWTAEGPTGL